MPANFRPHPVVDADGVADAERNPGLGRQLRIRAHAETENDHVGREGPLVGHNGLYTAGVHLEGLEGLFAIELDAGLDEGIGNKGSHVGVQRVHDLDAPVHKGNVQSPHDQRFGHLEADIAPADDDSPFRLFRIHGVADGDPALEGVEAIDPQGVATRDPGAERQGSRCDQEMIVGLPPSFLALEAIHVDAPVFGVDLLDLMEHPGVDTVIGFECLRSHRDEGLDVVDNLADVVGDASGRVGGVGASLECNDVQILAQPLCLGGGAHPCGVPADDHEPLLRHRSRLLLLSCE